MPKALAPKARRWGLPAVGLATVACIGCCAVPLVATGSLLGGGLAVGADPCFTPVWIVLAMVGVAASLVWMVRARNKSACGDDTDCGCALEPEVDVIQPEAGQLKP
jgi:hypothetical protein